MFTVDVNDNEMLLLQRCCNDALYIKTLSSNTAICTSTPDSAILWVIGNKLIYAQFQLTYSVQFLTLMRKGIQNCGPIAIWWSVKCVLKNQQGLH